MTEPSYIVLEKAVYGKKSFSENTEAYVESPMFARLLTLKSDVDRLTSMRYTDTLNDFTTGVLWPKDRDIFAQPNKKHDFFELVYVYEGSLNLRIEQTEYSFAAGSVFSLDLHLRSAIMPSRYKAFFLGLSKSFFQMLPSEYEQNRCKHSQVLHHIHWNLSHPSESHGFYYFQEKSDSGFRDLMQQFQSELSFKQAGYSIFLYGLVLRMISMLEDEQIFSHQYISLEKQSGQRITRQIHSFLQTHPYRISLAELTDELQLNYTPEYINKIYKDRTNESITSANRRIYLEESLRLLTTTKLTIAEISRKLHFRDRKSFYNTFEKEFACTPLQYRKRHSSSPPFS